MKHFIQRVDSWIRSTHWANIAILFVVVVGITGIVEVGLFDKFSETRETKTEKQKVIERIIQTEDFQLKINEEAEREYYQNVLDEAVDRLEELDGGGFAPNAMKSASLQAYLENNDAMAMIPYVDEIVELDRYMEVVAIVAHETSFCTRGVGSSRNNCGAIKNTSGDFKKYTTKLDAIEDVAILLQTPRYKDKTIAQMNGTYCVYEGGECPAWTENIEQYIEEMKLIAYASRIGE